MSSSWLAKIPIIGRWFDQRHHRNTERRLHEAAEAAGIKRGAGRKSTTPAAAGKMIGTQTTRHGAVASPMASPMSTSSAGGGFARYRQEMQNPKWAKPVEYYSPPPREATEYYAPGPAGNR